MKRFAFTLIELLVVIAIIAILAAILFPVFAQAKEAGKKTVVISNFKQVGMAVQLYLGDYDDRYFMSNSGGNSRGWGFGPPDTVPGQVLLPYIKNTLVYVDLKDPFNENMRIKDQCVAGGWNCNTLTTDQRLYALGVRSNLGYNYAFLSPWRLVNRNPTSATIQASEIGQVSNTLLFATAIWDRTIPGGEPTGGGNWVIETPCWQDVNGNLLRPFAQYAPGVGDGTLRSYMGGWVAPTKTVGQNAWLVYGGAWPYWNQTNLGNIQPGLKDGQVIVEMADSSTKSRSVKRLYEGCAAYGTGLFKGTVTDPDKFIWDLD